MAIQKTEAIVIKTMPFRSSSLIVTLFSRHFGKIKGIAKGVRREREVRGAVFELFTHVDVVFYEKTRSDLHLISEASILDSFEILRSRLDTIAYASYFAELVDVLTEIQDPHEEIFSLLEVCYRYLPAIPGEMLSRLFEVKLLTQIGWLPYLENCVQCGRFPAGDARFSIAQGALLCAGCAPRFRDARPLSVQALSTLQGYAARGLEEGIRVKPGPQVAAELRQLIQEFLLYRSQTLLKSRQFMESIRTHLV